MSGDFYTGPKWVEWFAVVAVVLIVIGLVLGVLFVLYLGLWWQPDCHHLMQQGLPCRDWPWQEVPRGSS